MRVSGKVGAGEDYMKSGRQRKLGAEWAPRKVGAGKVGAEKIFFKNKKLHKIKEYK